MPYLDRDGVRIHYDVAGSGPALLLTHGFAATSAMWSPNVDALAKDHTVVTWDLRGHGGSDYPDDPAAYSVPLSLGDMRALLDAAGAARAVIAGHSLGGYLSLEYHLAATDRVAGLVLVGTGPGFRKDDAREGWNRFASGYADRLQKEGLGALGRSEELRSAVHRDATGLERAARGILAQNDARVMDSLATIAVPTLVIVGGDDKQFLGGSEYMATKIPGARLALIEGAKHAPNLSHPDMFNDQVRALLDEVDRP
jgi:pimeloyl-ACP methyl ester carboxylesterase